MVYIFVDGIKKIKIPLRKREYVKFKKKMVKISIEGLIGAGKTTLCEILKENNHVVAVEPVREWKVKNGSEEFDVLEYFYKEPKKYACMFQTLALRSRVEQGRNITHGFVERCVHSDKVFGGIQHELKNMNDVEYATYLYQYEQAVADTIPVDGHIYIDASVETCMKRIEKRKRTGEDNIESQYLNLLKKHHDLWLNNGKEQSNVLVLDGEKDLHVESVRDEIISEIHVFLMRLRKLNKKKSR